MATNSLARKQHGGVMLAVLVILSLGATVAVAGAPASLLFQSPPPTPPPNDNFADATDVTALPFTDNTNNTYATIEAGEPQSCDYSAATVWYKLTPAVTGVYKANTSGSVAYPTTLSIWRGTTFGTLEHLTCGTYSPYLSFSGEAGGTYYLQLSTPSWVSPGDLTLNVSLAPPPANDNFANATAVTGLPYQDTQNIEGATVQSGEPTSSCAGPAPSRSIWYSYTPMLDASVTAYAYHPYSWFSVALAAYSGDSLTGLVQLDCRNNGNPLVFRAKAGVTYHFQVTNIYSDEFGDVRFSLAETPAPVADFYQSPWDPSKYDSVQFCDSSYDPVSMGFSEFWWDFGSGATATGYCANHQFGADGDYTVWHKVQTTDGRTGDVTKPVAVRTHDVAITKFTVPQSASAGQTRQIVVGLRNYNYPEDVQVELYKSVVGGYYWIGTLRQQAPVRSGNRTTDFNFSYTFTKDDAKMGKVTFRAVATIQTGRDALPADNEAISSPTKVSGK